MFSDIKKIFYKAAWAPVSVLLVHNGLSKLIGHREDLDPYFHFFGGAAIAYFFYTSIIVGNNWFGSPTPFARSFIAFCCSATVAVFWEFLEFAGGKITHVYAQISLDETMWDLIFGCTGAFTCLLIIGIIKKIRQ